MFINNELITSDVSEMCINVLFDCTIFFLKNYN